MRGQHVSSLILGAIDADMAPPRAIFGRLRKGALRAPVGRTSNPLRNVLPPQGHEEM
jgi:hypothetical protein